MSRTRGGETPQALTTEASVLGACLVEGTIWWDHLVKLSENDPITLFHDSHHRYVAMAMVDAIEGGGGITESSIEDQLIMRGVNEQFPVTVSEYLVQLQSTSSTMSLKSLATSIEELKKKRALRNQVSDLENIKSRVLQGEILDPGLVSKELSTMGLRTMARKEVKSMGDLIEELEEKREAAWTVPTGLTELDTAFGGGWEPGRTYVIAARPKVGKTTYMMSACVATLDANAVAIVISLETLKSDFYVKMVSTLSQVDKTLIKKLIFGDPKEQEEAASSLSDEDLEEIKVSREFLKSTRLYPSFAPDLASGFNSIPGIIFNIKYKHPNRPIVIYVDYLQLLVENQSYAQQEIAEYTRAFHLLAVEMGIAVVYLSQLNRDGVDGEMPSIRSLRGSGTIEQDVDSVILLNRKGLFDETEPEHLLEVFIALNRSGSPKKFKAYFSGVNNTVSDLDDLWGNTVIDEEEEEPYQSRPIRRNGAEIEEKVGATRTSRGTSSRTPRNDDEDDLGFD